MCMARGGETLETKKFPFDVYLILEKGVSLVDYQWSEPRLGDSDRKLRLCGDLLQGLVTRHRQRWMHRDITPTKILPIELNPSKPQPERAASCDFGKVLHTDWPLLDHQVLDSHFHTKVLPHLMKHGAASRPATFGPDGFTYAQATIIALDTFGLKKLQANGPGDQLKRGTRLPKWAPMQPSSPLHVRTDVSTLRTSRSLGGKLIC